jgi:glycosyltransferase involved in cell wall biosynthesis
MPSPRISIIINNFNYGRFLDKAIESALSQTKPAHEVILVDDGSTDNSLQVASFYADSIRIISKVNGGQASSFNAGFEAATGDWIWFLDADDMLMPDALENVQEFLHEGISKVHGKLSVIDEYGREMKRLVPSEMLADGDATPTLRTRGEYIWPPTSGNVFPRWLLEKCLPAPEAQFRLCVDLYVCNHAAVNGLIRATEKPLGYYRVHGKNNFTGHNLDGKRLKNQAMNIFATVFLFRQMFGEEHISFPYTRWNFETLVLAKRFADYSEMERFSHNELYKGWLETPEIKNLPPVLKTQMKAYWWYLRNMPAAAVEWLLGHRSARA